MSINMSAKTVPSRLASLFQRNGTDPAHNPELSARLEEPEATTSERTIGAATGAASPTGAQPPVEANQIVKAQRRRYSKAEKLRLLRLADACHERGQLGALLRREGIYHSTLRDFQKQRANGCLEVGYERDKQSTRTEADQDKKRIAELEAHNRQLQHKLEQAQLIIDVQKNSRSFLAFAYRRPSRAARRATRTAVRASGRTGWAGRCFSGLPSPWDQPSHLLPTQSPSASRSDRCFGKAARFASAQECPCA